MTRKTILLTLVFAISGTAHAQSSWVDIGPFPDSTTFWRSTHGVAVDAENKVWLSQYYPDPWILPSGDTLKDANGERIRTSALYVFNADGTRAMEPVRSFAHGGTTDTLYWDAKDGPRRDIRGVRADHNGDIIVVVGSSASLMFRLDHTTGEVMNKVDLGIGSPAAPGIDSTGNIYVAPVVGSAGPISYYDADFQLLGVVAESTPGIGRTLEVSADGNSVYWSPFTLLNTIKYQRPDEFSAYDSIGVVNYGLIAESSVRHPTTGHIWFGHSIAGSLSLVDTTRFGNPSTLLTWYALDPATDEIVDSLNFGLHQEFGIQKTRGIGFSPGGNVAYVGLFDIETMDPRGFPVKKLGRAHAENIERDPFEIPHRFTLSQNYPNPFNPQTKIEFELKDAGLAQLTVYDLLGREVSKLVDEHLSTGKYTATFTATNLPSGTYIYQLEVSGQRLTGKMLLVK